MDPNIVKQIIQDSAELLSKTAELADQAAEVPPLKQKIAELSNQNASLLRSAAESEQALVSRIEKFANNLVELGTLTQEKVASFVNIIKNDPTQIIDVMEKIGKQASSSVLDPGSPVSEMPSGSLTSKEASDPIVKFAMGG